MLGKDAIRYVGQCVYIFYAALLFLLSSHAAADTTEGLVAYYPFTGSAADASGTGNDGSVNSATLTADRNGNASSAYSFDSPDDYIEIADDATLDISGALTLAAWIKLDTLDNGRGDRQRQPIIQKFSADAGLRAYSLAFNDSYHDSYHKIQFVLSSTGSPFTGAVLVSDITPQQDTWYHIAAVFEPSTLMKIFINGSDHTGSITYGAGIPSSIAVNNLPVIIGKDSDNTQGVFDGVIDEVRIYNRALSAAEIQELQGAADITTTITTSVATTTTSLPAITSTTTVPNSATSTTTSASTTTSTPSSALLTADFVSSTNVGAVPLTVEFKSLCTGSVDAYAWDFGDGKSSLEASPTHAYDTMGSYSVVLTVTGPNGGTATEQKDGFVVALPACVFEQVLQDPSALSVLRAVRDRKFSAGHHFFMTALYYANAQEFGRLFRGNPLLQDRLRTLVNENLWIPAELAEKNHVAVPREKVRELVGFLDEMQAAAEPRLQAYLNLLRWSVQEGLLLEQLGIVVE